MRRLYISSLFRLEKVNEKSKAGAVYVVDWDDGLLLKDFDSMRVSKTSFLQPGNSYGSRGITIYRGMLCVATSEDTIFFYDLDTLEKKHTLRLDKGASLHQIDARGDRLYVCSTGTNELIVVEEFDVVDRVRLDQQAAVFDGDISDRWKTTNHWPKDKLHFNSIAWDGCGDEYHLYFSAGILYNYTKKKVVCQAKILRGGHDICCYGRFAFVCATSARKVYKIGLDTGEMEQVFYLGDRLDGKPPAQSGSFLSMWGTTRGMVIHGSSLFLGVSPGRIYELDLSSDDYEVLNLFRLPTKHYECIFDMVLDPRDW